MKLFILMIGAQVAISLCVFQMTLMLLGLLTIVSVVAVVAALFGSEEEVEGTKSGMWLVNGRRSRYRRRLASVLLLMASIIGMDFLKTVNL